MNEQFEHIRLLSVIADRFSSDANVERALDKSARKWDALERLMETNRVWPQVASNLARRGMLERAPAKTREALEKARRDAAAYNMLAQDTAQMVMDEAGRAGIDLMPLKGIALLGSLYEAGERSVSDIDFLTRSESADAMGKIFLNMGFDKLEGGLSERFEDVFSGEKKYVINRGGANVVAELHWNVSPGRALEKLFPLDAELLWSGSKSGGRDGMSGEMEIVYLLHHLAVRHCFCRLMWILDIRYLLKERGAALSMELLKKELDSAGLGKPAWLMGWFIKEMLGDEPPEVLTRREPNPAEKAILASLAVNSLSGGAMKTSGLFPGLLSQRPHEYYYHWLFPGKSFLKERYPGVPETLLNVYRARDIAGKIFRRK